MAEIAGELGITKPTVCYHRRKLGYPIDARFAARYDWAAVQRHYDAGHSKRECEERFGFSPCSWSSAVKRGAIVPRPRAMPLEDLLAAGTKRGRWNLRQRLLAAGLKENRCEQCGITSWRDRSLTMALHHVNGNRHDNRLENLALLCPMPQPDSELRDQEPGTTLRRRATGSAATAERSSRRRRAAGR